jgi:hypothetical protein
MYHLGLARHGDLTTLAVGERLLLLNSVLFVDDGVNERGVSMALASIEPEPLRSDEGKKRVSLWTSIPM